MARLPRGLHQSIITSDLAARIEEARRSGTVQAKDDLLHEVDAPDILAKHVADAIRRAVAHSTPEERTTLGTRLVREVLDVVARLASPEAVEGDTPIEPARVLRQVVDVRPDGTAPIMAAPSIPLVDTTLLTNAPGEPGVGRQIATELESADRVDLVMAFIRLSGIQPFAEALRALPLSRPPRTVRVLTTTYTGTTEARALDLLRELGAEVRVSYDTGGTRLHAKAWIFHRDSGFSTAYIGSSNLTRQAQVTGLEWNVRVSGARNPEVVAKMAAVFDAYWSNPDFEAYDRDEFIRRRPPNGRSLAANVWGTEIRLQPFQEGLLERIEVSRRLGHHRNLLVAATGTGKTVMAAVDFARFRERHPNARLLFVAHRQEILEQARRTFAVAVGDPGFGELWVGDDRPVAFAHIFASIQNLRPERVCNLAPDDYDMVVVDEFHHAAAASYQALLSHVRPKELLGLTATPERSDGLPILQWFDGRIAAELRLWDAISQGRLVPFHYYGAADKVADYSTVTWRRGTGYDAAELTRLLTGTDAWARLVIGEVRRRVPDPHRMRALGFCAGIEHARHMAHAFNQAGIAAVAIWGDTPEDDRRRALLDLRAWRVNVVFSVDILNEGVDVPAVDALLLLRPTDSPVLFLQQLGRGLRLHHGKSHCLVLDFVGHHRKEFRFDRRFRALLGGTRTELTRQVRERFPFLPSGCHMELDPIASRTVLENIRASLPTTVTGRIEELRAFGRNDVTLGEFLKESGLDLDDVYAGAGRGWSELRERAGLGVREAGPHEEKLRRAVARLLHVDDLQRIDGWHEVVRAPAPPSLARLDERGRRLVRMLVTPVLATVAGKDESLEEALATLWRHPQVLLEIDELFGVLHDRVSHATRPLDATTDVPLDVHASYSRAEILAAYGVGDGARSIEWREGVRWVEGERTDILLVTADKSTRSFSPTTRYRDHAVSRTLFHWESQSTTRADSATGRRYREHVGRGSKVVIFARPSAAGRAFLCLGHADYVSHVSERPMGVTWRLQVAMPADTFAWLAVAA